MEIEVVEVFDIQSDNEEVTSAIYSYDSDTSENTSTEISTNCLSKDCRQVIKNVFNYCNNIYSKTEAVTKTSKMTKITERSIWRIITEDENTSSVMQCNASRKKKLSKVDNFVEDAIRRTIYECYKRNIVPTTKSIMKKLEDSFPYKSKETLRKCLQQLGFTYKIINRRVEIMESSRIVEMLKVYLQKIEKARAENRPIFYLDETWMDTHEITDKGWIDDSGMCRLNVPPSRGQRITILHAGSEHGWSVIFFKSDFINNFSN